MHCTTFLTMGGFICFSLTTVPPSAHATACLLWWALLHIKAAEGISAMPAYILHNIFVWLLNQLRNHRHGHAHNSRNVARPFPPPPIRCSSCKFSSLRRLTLRRQRRLQRNLQPTARALHVLQQTMQQATIGCKLFSGSATNCCTVKIDLLWQ